MQQCSGLYPGTESGNRPEDKPVINRSSTECFDSLSVYIGAPFFCASEKPFGTVVCNSSESKQGGCALGEPTCRSATLTRTAPLPRRAVPRPDTPVVCSGCGFDKYGFWTRCVACSFRTRACHERGLQKQKSVVALVSKQERRTALVPQVKRRSNAGQPRILFHRFPWCCARSCF